MDVFGCNRQFRDALLQLEESHGSLIGLLFWLGFRRKTIFYHRRRRQHGKTAWSLGKKLNYLMDSVFSFSDLPVKVLLAVGGVGLLFSLFFGVVVTALRLIAGAQVPGYAATVLVILFLGGLNMVGLGIIGAYIWRAFANTQGRPLSVVMRTEAFPGRNTGLRGESDE